MFHAGRCRIFFFFYCFISTDRCSFIEQVKEPVLRSFRASKLCCGRKRDSLNPLSVSVKKAKNPSLRTHTDTWEPGVSMLTLTHTSWATPRDGTTNLILCWHTIPQMCHAFTVLSLSLSLSLSLTHHVGILKQEVYSSLSVSAEGWVHSRPEVCLCVPGAHSTSVLQTTFPTDCTTQHIRPKTAGLCRSSDKVAPRSSDGYVK